jgi:hypothetical protein
MNESEDTLEMFEAKEQAHNEGCITGFLFGVPAGTLITLFIGWLTMGSWLPYFK